MQCSSWDELMSLRLDGLLSPAQEQQLQAHLADCQTCRGRLAVLSHLSSRLKAEPPAIPAPDFTARVTARLQQREARRRRLYSSVGICVGSVGLWAVAALAVLCLFAVLVDPSVRTVLVDVVLSIGQNALAFVTVVGEALWFIAYALLTSPAALLVVGYAVLAVAVGAFWTRVVLRRQSRVLE